MLDTCLIALLALLTSANLAWAQDNASDDPGDLPPNRGFEVAAPDSQLPARWQARGVTLPAHRLVPEARSGDTAAEIRFTEGEGNLVSGYYYSEPAPLPACDSVTVSAWVRVRSEEGSPGKGAYLRLLFQKGDTYVKLFNSAPLADSGGEWARMEVSAVPPADADAWRMSVEFAGIGNAIYDDAAVEFAPCEIIPEASLDAPSGVPLSLGDGRYGVLGAAAPAEGSGQVQISLKGRSALPQAIDVGVVCYRGATQLGVSTVPTRAWSRDTVLTMPPRILPQTDTLRPIAFAGSQASWSVIEVGLPTLVDTTTDQPPPLRISPQPHPRLFVGETRLEELKARLKNNPPPELKAQYDRLIAFADQCFTEETIVVYSGRYSTTIPPAEPPRHEDNFPYWTGLSRKIEERIESLAAAYLLTGEQRYADLGREWTLAVCEWSQWTDPDYSSRDACLDTGHFCHAVAIAYDFLFPALSEDDRKTIRDALLEKGAAAVMRAGEAGWARTMSWPNGFAVVMGGMGIAGIATLGDDDRAAEYVDYSRRRLWEFLEARDRDGGYVEGLTYGGYAMTYTVPFAATLALHGDDLLDAHPYMANTLRFAAYCLAPVGATSVNFCDASVATRAYNPLAGWRALAGDGLGRWYLERNEGLTALWRYIPPLSVLWCPIDTQPENLDAWEPAQHYSDIGWVIARSSFQEDGFLVAMRSGYHGSHCQLDQNSIMLNLAGEWLLSDPGYGRAPTELHSTLLVDGKGQAGAGGAMQAFGTVGGLTYAVGDAAACYPALETFRRHLLVLDRKLVVVVDEVSPADSAPTVLARWMTGVTQPRLEESGRVVLQGEKRCDMVFSGNPQEATIGEVQGVKTIDVKYSIEGPALRAVVITPGGRPPSASISFETIPDAMHVRITDGDTTHRVLLNLTGEPATVAGVTSDARVTWLKTGPAGPERMAVVWGSKVTCDGDTFLDEADKQDISR